MRHWKQTFMLQSYSSPVSLVISVTVNIVTQAKKGGSNLSPMVFNFPHLIHHCAYLLFL